MADASTPVWPTLTRSYSLSSFVRRTIDDGNLASQLGTGRIKMTGQFSQGTFLWSFSLRHLSRADLITLEQFYYATCLRGRVAFYWVDPLLEAQWTVRFLPKALGGEGMVVSKEPLNIDKYRADIQLLQDEGSFGIGYYGYYYFGV